MSASSPEPSQCSSDVNSNASFSPQKQNKRKSPHTNLRGDSGSSSWFIDLSQETQTILSELLLEGNVLETSVDETRTLWKIWIHANPNVKTVVFYSPFDPQKKKLELEKELSKANNKRTSSQDQEQEMNDFVVENKKKKKDEKSHSISGKGKSKRKEEEKEDLCSMQSKCLRPEVDQVNWVQCDGVCEGWFHQLCIGITSPEQLDQLEQFFCTKCRQNANVEDDTSMN